MSLTREETKLHQKYEDANKIMQSLVDRSYDAVNKLMKEAGLMPVGDDRAEALVAHIYEYILESKPKD